MKKIVFIEDDPLKQSLIKEVATGYKDYNVGIFTCEVEFLDFYQDVMIRDIQHEIPDLFIVDLMLEWNSEDYPGAAQWSREDPDMAGERISGLLPQLEAKAGKKIGCLFWTAIGSDTLPQDKIFYKDDVKLIELFEDLVPRMI